MKHGRGEPTRREALGMLGVAAGAFATAGPDFLATLQPGEPGRRPARRPSCVVTPAQSEGPYFVDEMLERRDLRLDPADGTTREGLPLRLDFAVHRVDGDMCTPVRGALVDVWQCDLTGLYSGVRDIQGRFDTRDSKFLRGYQVTDAAGEVEFQTIFPGWYPGRTPHLHLKVRTTGDGPRYEFTSQLYFDEAVIDRVYAAAPYSALGPRTTRNDRDGIFLRENGAGLVLAVAEEPGGLRGTFDIGLRMA